MRVLLGIIVAVAALWSGYWFVGKSTVESSVAAALAQAPAQGLEITHQGYAVAGFPSRFDLTFTAPDVQDQAQGFRWQAPFLQLFSLSYKPWHIIATFPPQQQLTLQGQIFDLTADKLQASLVVQPNSDLPLDRSTLVGDNLRLLTGEDLVLAAQTLRLASRLDPSIANTHQLGLELLELTPAPQIASLMPQLPAQISILRVDAVTSFTAPLDRNFAQTQPQLTQVDLREALLNWGEMSLNAKGKLAVVEGYPEGKLELRVTGWRNLLPLLTGMGVISPEHAKTVERFAQMLAAGSGDAQSLTLPLVFAKGRVSLGPIPLGAAPRLAR